MMTPLNLYFLVMYDADKRPLYFSGLDDNNQPRFTYMRNFGKQLSPHEALEYEKMVNPFFPVFIRGVNSRFL